MYGIALLAGSFAAALANAATIDFNAGYINYTAVTGYFLQDDPATNASTFNYVSMPQRLRRQLWKIS